MTTLTGVGDYLLVGFKGKTGVDPSIMEKNLKFARKSRNMSLPDYRLLFHLIITEDLKDLFGPGPLHTDERPRLEFAAPRQLYTTDPTIETNLTRTRVLSNRTKRLLRSVAPRDVLLDMVEFSASAFAPLFNLFDPAQATPAQEKRYREIVERYCGKALFEQYGTIAELQLAEKCACLQAKAIKRHLARDPRDGAAYYSLGLAFKRMGKRDEAIKAFERAILLDPFQANAYTNLGVAYMEKGDLDRARSILVKAIEVDPAHARAFFNLAQLSLRQGRREEALGYLKEGLKYEDNPQARRLLTQILLAE